MTGRPRRGEGAAKVTECLRKVAAHPKGWGHVSRGCGRARMRSSPIQWGFQPSFSMKPFSVEHGYLDICFKYVSSFARMIFLWGAVLSLYPQR